MFGLHTSLFRLCLVFHHTAARLQFSIFKLPLRITAGVQAAKETVVANIIKFVAFG